MSRIDTAVKDGLAELWDASNRPSVIFRGQQIPCVVSSNYHSDSLDAGGLNTDVDIRVLVAAVELPQNFAEGSGVVFQEITDGFIDGTRSGIASGINVGENLHADDPNAVKLHFDDSNQDPICESDPVSIGQRIKNGERGNIAGREMRVRSITLSPAAVYYSVALQDKNRR